MTQWRKVSDYDQRELSGLLSIVGKQDWIVLVRDMFRKYRQLHRPGVTGNSSREPQLWRLSAVVGGACEWDWQT